MKAIDFEERTIIFAEYQEEYLSLPALVKEDSTVVFCMKLSRWERWKLLFTGKLWCGLLMFGQPLTPSYFTVNKKDLI